MAQFTPYVMAAAGAYLLMLAATTRSNGALAFLTVKIGASLLGAVAIWFSAVALVGGA